MWRDTMKKNFFHPGAAVWIVDYTLYKQNPLTWTADAYAIDGNYGCGKEYEYTRDFPGVVSLISLHEQILLPKISIGLIHFSRGGFNYLISDIDNLPKPPFLISSNLDITLIFDGYVKINGEQDVIHLDDPGPWIYAISSENWFGMMTVLEEEKLHLVAFSSDNHATVLKEDCLWSFEYDCSVGRIGDVGEIRFFR